MTDAPEREPELGDPFHARTERQNGTAVIKLSGALASGCEKQFQAEVEVAGKEPVDGIVLDLRKLTFIDSAGLRMVLETGDRCRDAGHDFGVIRGRGQVRRAFELTRIEEALPMMDDLPSGTE